MGDEGRVPKEAAQRHLERVLASKLFSRSERMSRFLRFSVEAALSGNSSRIKEYVVGLEVFDRGQTFDPRIDPVVRVEARRLRARLKQWHEGEGRDSAIVINLPTGAYAAELRYRGTISAREKTIAVLPFANLNADAELDYFSDGLTEELIHALTRLPGLRVVAWPSASRLKGQEQDLDTIRERLHVETILRGSVRRSREQLRMTAQLVDAADGHFLWSEAWNRPADHLVAIEQEIARAIVEKLRLDLTADRRGALLPQARDQEAHMAYLRARFEWNKRTPEGLQLALTYFTEATERDPEWPLAWAGLADAYATFATYAMTRPVENLLRSREAAERALGLDPNLAEAITCLASYRGSYDRDWEESEALYRRAIRLNPSYATAHHWYGGDLLAMHGRFEEAHKQMEIAAKLDPLSGIILETRGLVSMVSGRYEEAHQRYEDMLKHDPGHFRVWSALGRLYTQMGKYDAAIEMFQKARSVAGDYSRILGAMGQTYALAGEPDKARELLQVLERMAMGQYIANTTFALIHLGLGEMEAVIQRVEAAIDQWEFSVMWLKVHPAWERLRSHPHFPALLSRLRLT